jgi:hypothetical protein
MSKNLEMQAVEELKATLQQISVIKVKEIRIEPHGRRSEKDIIASVEIYGHGHVMVCRVTENANPHRVRRILQEMRAAFKGVQGKAPVLIAPSLSAELQALCREDDIGFLDLEGNARLYLNEVFIVKRSLPHRQQLPPPAEPLPTSETARFAHSA